MEKLSKKLNLIFKNKIKLSTVSEKSVIIVTKDDKCYEIEIDYTSQIIKNPLLTLSDEIKINSLIEETYVKELSNKQVIDFKYGLSHSIARNSDGYVYCWGYNAYGALGNGSSDSGGFKYKAECNKFLFNLNVIDMCCGYYHTLVLTITGDVYAWGRNRYGQIGNGMSGDEECQLTPFRLTEFKGENIKGISCGSNHSMALTESGRVYSWGRNDLGQLGIGDREDLQSPKHVEVDYVVEKIKCGNSHSLLLTIDGDIYVCGRYRSRIFVDYLEFFTTPIRISHSEKFKDIASHFIYFFSAAISVNSVLFIWGELKNEVIIEPKITKFKSFNDAFEQYSQITYEPNKGRVIRFYDDFTENGKYEKEFIERRKIGEGSYGDVYDVILLSDNSSFAIKSIKFKSEDKKEFLAELETSPIISKLSHENIVKYSSYWLENDFILENGIKKYNQNFILYMRMKLCDQSLDKIIKEMEKDSNMYSNETLTPFGYYISNKIFVDILKGVNYLHQQKPPIIHRDLKPENIIMLKEPNDFTMKIADMGLATLHKFVLPSISRISNSQTLHTKGKGTQDYIAPEVEEAILDHDKSKARYDTKADVFSLGVIFKKLLHINIDRVYIDDENQVSIIHNKYEEAKHLCIRMISQNPIERPDCGEVLKCRHLWAFTPEELNTLIDFEREFKSNHSYNSFVDRLQNNKFLVKFTDYKKIGIGHYGKVYEVREIYNLDNSKNRFAIKIIKLPLMYEKEFIKEIRACLSIPHISHYNIVKYYDLWLENDFIFEGRVKIKIKNFLLHIQMELCDETLADLFPEMKNAFNTCSNQTLTYMGYYMASKIFVEILEGVNYLHTRNPPIIHSNLNPSNIMLKIDYYSNSFVKITNPSLVAIYKYVNHSSHEDKNYTLYLATEVEEKEKLDTRADIFSLGIILQDLFCIESKRDNMIQNKCQSKYLQNIFKLCEKMTKKHKIERPNNIGNIIEEIQMWASYANELQFNKKFEKILKAYNYKESFVFKLLEKMLFNDGFIQSDKYREELEKIKTRDSYKYVLDLKDVWESFKERHGFPKNNK